MFKLYRIIATLILVGSTSGRADEAEIHKFMAKWEFENSVSEGKGLCYLLEKQSDRELMREFAVFTRGGGDNNTILITKPKTESGRGYLRIDKNIWSYNPKIGRWDRRTEREGLAGTNLRTSDVGPYRYRENYTATDDGFETLDGIKTRRVKLVGKPDADVPFPVIKIWIDDQLRMVKSQDLASSGTVMRTTYYLKYARISDAVTKRTVWQSFEARIFDEIETGRVTTLIFKQFEAIPVPPNVFTKAWLEGNSR